MGSHEPGCDPAALGPGPGLGHSAGLGAVLLLLRPEPRLLAGAGEVPGR